MRNVVWGFTIVIATVIGILAGRHEPAMVRAAEQVAPSTGGPIGFMLATQSSVEELRKSEAKAAAELARIEELFNERITRLEKIAAVQRARLDEVEAGAAKVAANVPAPPKV